MHTHRRTHARSVVTLSLFLALAASPVLADDAADRQAIESAAQQWTHAFNSRDAAALAAVSTDDVLVLDTGSGPSQATQAWLRASALTQGGIKTASKEIVVSGDTAWRVATVAYKRSGAELHKGQSLEIWKRTPAGWRLHRQMSSNILEQTLRPSPSEPVLDKPTN
ncbi:MAG TPA: nuclear transport factor 2 family protein [Steroidobacter sp.]|uniref:YybH family protein n=1 Tax=Steroidobacter sp. TaxID=1978227 RepID=UPI002EDB37C9